MKNKGLIFSLIASFLWAVGIVNNRYIVSFREQEFRDNALNIAFLSSLLTLPYWLYVLGKSKTEVRKISRRTWILIILSAIAGGALVKIFDIVAVNYTNAINFSLFVKTSLIFTVIFEFIIFRNPITKKKIVLIISLLLGLYLVIVGNSVIKVNIGDLIAIAEAIVIALGNNILGKLILAHISPKLSASLNTLIGFIPLTIIVLIFGTIEMPINIINLVLASVTSLLLTLSRFKALSYVTPTYLTMMFSLTPLFTIILSMVFLGERMTVIQLAGGMIIILSVFVVEKLKI